MWLLDKPCKPMKSMRPPSSHSNMASRRLHLDHSLASKQTCQAASWQHFLNRGRRQSSFQQAPAKLSDLPAVSAPAPRRLARSASMGLL